MKGRGGGGWREEEREREILTELHCRFADLEQLDIEYKLEFLDYDLMSNLLLYHSSSINN